MPADPTDQYVPPTLPGFRETRTYPLRPDLRRARRLAGGSPREAVLYIMGGPPTAALAEIVKSNLRAIGIEVQIRNLGPGLFERLERPGEPFDMALVAWFADYPDPINFLSLLDGRADKFNFGHFDDPTYNHSLDVAARLPGSARLLALGRLDARVAREQAPWAAISNERVHDFFSERIGCQLYTAMDLLDLAALRLRP
jgi:ABC-type oligopeptide transport system substrate-binding subunit